MWSPPVPPHRRCQSPNTQPVPVRRWSPGRRLPFSSFSWVHLFVCRGCASSAGTPRYGELEATAELLWCVTWRPGDLAGTIPDGWVLLRTRADHVCDVLQMGECGLVGEIGLSRTDGFGEPGVFGVVRHRVSMQAQDLPLGFGVYQQDGVQHFREDAVSCSGGHGAVEVEVGQPECIVLIGNLLPSKLESFIHPIPTDRFAGLGCQACPLPVAMPT